MVNVQIFNGFWSGFKTLFKATECESLMLIIKAVGSGELTAGSKGLSVLVIPAIDKELRNLFWDIFRRHAPPDCLDDIQVRIGAAFLRTHRYLLN